MNVTDPSLFKQREETGNDSPLAPEPEWKARYELLRARIEELETHVESLLRGAPPQPHNPHEASAHRSAPQPEELHSGRYAGSPAREEFSFPPVVSERSRPPSESASSGAQQRPADSKTLEEISLLTTCDDAGNGRIVEMLRSILTQAGWKVRHGAPVRNGVEASPGLTLIASPALCRARLSHTFMALSAAGFAVTLHLDQNRQPTETTLFVGQNVEYRSEDASGSEPPVIADVA